jgi:hypothetical protein
MRLVTAGPGPGPCKTWLLWDGKRGIQVELVDRNFKNTL